MSSWPTFWVPITSAENPASEAGHGVYRVRATTAQGIGKRVRRACEDDDEGVVYIGQGALRDRIGALLDRDGHAGTHSFLETFRDYELDRICPRTSLEIQWYECDNPEAKEQGLLEKYKREFGDLPPGNLKLGQRRETR